MFAFRRKRVHSVRIRGVHYRVLSGHRGSYFPLFPAVPEKAEPLQLGSCSTIRDFVSERSESFMCLYDSAHVGIGQTNHRQ